MPFDPFFSSSFKKKVHHEHDAAWEKFKALPYDERWEHIRKGIARKKSGETLSGEEISLQMRFFADCNARNKVRRSGRHNFYSGGAFAELNRVYNASGTFSGCPRQTKRPHGSK